MGRLDKDIRQLADVLKATTITLAALLLSMNLTVQGAINPPETVEHKISYAEPLEAPVLAKIDEVEEVPTPKPKPAPVASVKPTGDKCSWMQQAGIPESDWQYVDEIITRESNWNYKAVNRSSGATGLCQSLPASKMASAGGDYLTNPVTQLRWCHQYAQGYGGWKNAVAYSRCIGRCFSTRTNTWVNKDHKWW